MTEHDTKATQAYWGRSAVGFWLSAVGILALVIGLLTPWADIDVEQGGDFETLSGLAVLEEVQDEYGSESPSGLSLDDGKIVLLMLILFVALYVIHRLVRTQRGKGLPIAMIVVGAIALVTSFVNIGDIGDADDTVKAVGLPISFGVGIGLYLDVLGGVLATAGAAVLTAKAGSRKAPDPAALSAASGAVSPPEPPVPSTPS